MCVCVCVCLLSTFLPVSFHFKPYEQNRRVVGKKRMVNKSTTLCQIGLNTQHGALRK